MSDQQPSVLDRHPRKLGAAAVAAAILLATPVILHLEGTRQVGYLDVVRVATSCTGHTGADAVVGRRYSKAECDSQLGHDLARTADGIAGCITVAVPPPSLAAFDSFAFNVGVGAFCHSSVERHLNAGDLRGACAGLSAWTYAGGRPIQGLISRRATERALCERGLRPASGAQQ